MWHKENHQQVVSGLQKVAPQILRKALIWFQGPLLQSDYASFLFSRLKNWHWYKFTLVHQFHKYCTMIIECKLVHIVAVNKSPREYSIAVLRGCHVIYCLPSCGSVVNDKKVSVPLTRDGHLAHLVMLILRKHPSVSFLCLFHQNLVTYKTL